LSQADPGMVPLDLEQSAVARLQAGDRAAAAELYQWYGDRLYRAAILPRLPNRELAEDVLKDTFRLALERIEQFKPQGRSIYFWLRRIAINRAIDVHRANKRTRDHEERHTEAETIDRTMGKPPPRPDRGQEVAETRDMVESSLSMMNERYATALRLRLIEDRDRDECAEQMGVTVGNFDVILHRACKAFKKVYPP
jgi:RNA polymerase sigma factor (sigma-70 family)